MTSWMWTADIFEPSITYYCMWGILHNLNMLVGYHLQQLPNASKLLNLLCPPDNHFPQSLYKFIFFLRFSSVYERVQFCSDCLAQFRKHQSCCDNPSCRHNEPSSMISFNPTKAIRRVLKSKFYKKSKIQKNRYGIMHFYRELG